MVGRFAGWLINFPALPNWVSMFQNSTGSSNTTSFTLQNCTLPVAWFSICRKCLSCLILDNSVSRSPLQIPFARLLVLEIYPITYFKSGWCPVTGLLCSFEAIFIQHLLGNDQCESVCLKIQHSRIWVS